MKKISRKMTFAKLLSQYPELAEVFIEEEMHCIGCPMAAQETIEEGCKAHGIDAEKIVEKLNKKLGKNKNKKK